MTHEPNAPGGALQVLLLHPLASARASMREALSPALAEVTEAGRRDEVDLERLTQVIVAHPSFIGWTEVIAEARQRHPALRVVCHADELPAAVEAVNVARADHLLTGAPGAGLASALRLVGDELESRPGSPPTARAGAAELDAAIGAYRSSAVGKLTGAVAHELNSPLTSIMVFSEALARKTTEEPGLHEPALEVHQAAQKCRRLIQGLLSFARRRRSPEPEALSLPAVCSEVQTLVQHHADMARVRLEVEDLSGAGRVFGRTVDLELLLLDLVQEAVAACRPGDTVRVAARDLAPEGPVELSVTEARRASSPEASPTGAERGSTAHTAWPTAGGVVTARQVLATALGADLEIVTAEDGGATVRVRLPAAPAQEGRR
ncbi:MAG: HAMP domain-containing histidine kinase [Deltaproteobacteria bacterium]|nr:HAMP domain-containing histidine kinase [Deltaproteobacteria bacterium]